MAENSLYTKQTNIGLLGAVFLFFLEKKNTVTVKIFLLVLKCPKINCFMLQSQKFLKC